VTNGSKFDVSVVLQVLRGVSYSYSPTIGTYVLGTQTVSPADASGWIHVDVQVLQSATDFAFNVWIKVGATGAVAGPYTQVLPFTLFAGGGWYAWMAIVGWTGAGDDDFSNVVMDLFHMLMMAGTDVPSNAQIDLDASRNSPNTSALGDYLLNFIAGDINMNDQSGNGPSPLDPKSGGTQGALAPI
jgi:hypothetical protein